MPTARRIGGGALSFLALALCLTAPAPRAQSLPRRINCGDLNGWGLAEPGYELLSETSAPPGVSLLPAPLDTSHVAGNQPNFYGEFPLEADFISVDADQLDQTHRLTSLQLADPTILRLDGLAPSTPHRVKLELGGLAPWSEISDFYNPPYWSYESTVSRDVRVERRDSTGAGPWQTALSGVRCSSSYKGPSFESILGGIVDVWVLAFSNASGRLELRLSTDGSDPLFLAGLEVHADEALPIVYRRDASGPLQALTSAVQPFVAAFNAGDHQAAADIARLLPDPFERGVAQLHLIGWLDGSRDGFSHLVDQAADALTAALPGHPAAAWLLDELDAYHRALLHLFASGRTIGHTCPEDGGLGFLTTECAPVSLNIDSLTRTNVNAHIAIRELAGLIAPVHGQTVLEDLVDWNAGSLGEQDWQPSPLVFQAAKLTGTTLASMNPQWSPGEGEDAEAFAALRDGLLRGFVDLGFADNDFADDLELRLFDLWTDQAVLPVSWPLADYEDLFSEQQLADAWWGELVQLPPATPGAPEWADLLRHQRKLLRALARYWLVDRLEAGEFGGGLGDDVELLSQFGKLFVGHQSPSDQPALDGLDTLVRWTLGGSGDVQGGYFAGALTDVEHSAEYTTNSWSALGSAFGQTATAAEIALGVTEHLRFEAQPELAFAAPTTAGRLHLRSYHFTTDGPDTQPKNAWDTLLNGRALLPGWATARRGLLDAGHPLVADLGAWAQAWRDDALAPAPGKPSGWYGPVQWPSNKLGNAGWWTHKGDPDDTFELAGGVHSYTLDLLRAAYLRSTASDRWRFLLPGVRMFRAVKAWEDGGQPGGAAGSEPWAAARFKDSPRFGPIAASWLGDLAGDPDLNSLPDPKTPGSTYVDAALLERLQHWIADEFNGQLAVTQYVHADVQPCGTGFTAKSAQLFTGGYAKTISYYRVLFPLLSKHVIHTDRIALGAGLSNLAVAETGANLIEGIAHQPLVRWRDVGEVDRDFVVQCNHRDAAGTLFSAFVYNFEPQPVDIELLLDAGLQPGLYRINFGEGDPKCDLFQPGAGTDFTLVDKRGLGARTELRLDPGLSLVRLERLGPASAPPAGYDLAVDTPRAYLASGAHGPELRLSARVSNPSSQATPPATLSFYAGALDLEGGLIAGELGLAQVSVPSLPACTGWTPESYELTVAVPLADPGLVSLRAGPRPAELQPDGLAAGGPAPSPDSPASPGSTPAGPGAGSGQGLPALADLLDGLGLRLRVLVTAGADESDPLNNEAQRGFRFEQIVESEAIAGH